MGPVRKKREDAESEKSLHTRRSSKEDPITAWMENADKGKTRRAGSANAAKKQDGRLAKAKLGVNLDHLDILPRVVNNA